MINYMNTEPKMSSGVASNGREISASKKVDDISKHESKHDSKHDPKHVTKYDPRHDSIQKPEDGTKPGVNQNPGGKPLPGEPKR